MSTSTHDSDRADKLMTHDYDGIREYDNPTPGWWYAIFLGSVLFAVLYLVVFHLSPLGKSLGLGEHARLAAAVEKDEATSLAKLGVLTSDGATLMRLSTDEFALGKGAAIFSTACIACHRADGGGVIGLGPNLTDDFGKNVQTPEDVYSTIAHGVEATAMTAQEPLIGKDNTILVAAYVISLRGRNVAEGKEAEGEAMPAWPANAAGDE